MKRGTRKGARYMEKGSDRKELDGLCGRTKYRRRACEGKGGLW